VVEILTHAIFLALSGSKLILVIDDEEKILSVVSSMLHTLRYECYAAVDGVEGCNEYFRAKANSRPFSAVLLDTTIPNGISGEEALKLILAEDPDARVILCSGYADGDLFEKPEQLGFKAQELPEFRSCRTKSALPSSSLALG
jgi:CheY-like chemotaxis protein